MTESLTIIPPALPREFPMRVAIIAEGAITPLGNSADETWEGFEAGRTGIVPKHYSPYTEKGRLIPDNLIADIINHDPVLGRVLDSFGDTPTSRNFLLNEYLAENPGVNIADLDLKEAEEQIRATTAGTVKNYDPIENLVKTGVMPRKEVLFKMDPYAIFALGAAFEAVSKVRTADGIPFLIPRLNPDGSLNKERQWTMNKDLVHPLHVSTFVGTGFGGGAVSAEVLQLLQLGVIPSGDHMMRSLSDRAASLITQAFDTQGGAESDTAACASSGRAMLNAMLRIATGLSVVSIVVGTEGLERLIELMEGKFRTENPITAAEFDSLGALDPGTDPLKVSRSLHQVRRGFTIAEGAVAFVLADPDWVRRNRIPILYEIVGFGETSGAGQNTDPNTLAQEQAMRFARRRAEAVGSIVGKTINSGHLTGTPVGEGSEMGALKKALEDMQKRAIIYATKRLTGHMLGAAGNLSQFVAGKALQEGIVPGMIFDGEAMEEAEGWNIPRETHLEPELTDAVVNQFGFGDANVSLWLRKAS